MSKSILYLEEKIKEHLEPFFIEIEDESPKHFNHSSTLNSHYKILIVSDKFETLTQLQRHRMLYEIFQHDLKTRIHALSLSLYTKEEYYNQ